MTKRITLSLPSMIYNALDKIVKEEEWGKIQELIRYIITSYLQRNKLILQ